MDGRRVSRLAGVLLAAGIGAALVAGCSSGASSSDRLAATAGGAGGAGERQVPAAAPPGGDVKADSGATAPKPQAPNQAPQQQVNQPGVDRKLIRTASLELASPKVIEVVNGARKIASDLGGYAGQEDVRGDQASLTLHIPSNQFDKALGQLSDLVKPEQIRSRTQTAEDVTEQLVDVESRIATQRTSVDRVRALLARAQTVNEIVQIESEVTRREADLESLEKRREALTGQVALSKVTLKVSKGNAPAPPPAADERSGFLGGLIGGWHAFLSTGGGVLRVVGAVLPFLIVLGPAGWLALRWWRRRDKPLAPAVQQQPGS